MGGSDWTGGALERRGGGEGKPCGRVQECTRERGGSEGKPCGRVRETV
jgi:hypothetical protein